MGFTNIKLKLQFDSFKMKTWTLKMFNVVSFEPSPFNKPGDFLRVVMEVLVVFGACWTVLSASIGSQRANQ